MSSCIEKIKNFGFIPVVKLEDPSYAVPVVNALKEGGLPLIEVTFRTSCAAEAISLIKKNCPDILLGAGTVVTSEQALSAVAIGVDFIVSPGFNREVSQICKVHCIPYFGGCITPTEIEAALAEGLNIVKFFPAEQFGGVKTIKALSGPYRDVKFIPTGGVSLDNLASYISAKPVLACGGSFMVPSNLSEPGAIAKITELTKKTVEIIAQTRGKE